jgi:hypothetical protein
LSTLTSTARPTRSPGSGRCWTRITADALRCQREHVTYLAERGAHWILTVKGNQLHLHAQLAALPWRAVPDATRDTISGHGRREIRTLKVLTISTGIDFPHAAQGAELDVVFRPTRRDRAVIGLLPEREQTR